MESDLDGSPADETVRLSLDERHVELDLSSKQAAKLRELLAPYIAAGRPAAKPGGHARRAATRSDYDEIRRWARANGIPVGEQGRISQSIIDQYDARREGGPLAVVS